MIWGYPYFWKHPYKGFKVGIPSHLKNVDSCHPWSLVVNHGCSPHLDRLLKLQRLRCCNRSLVFFVGGGWVLMRKTQGCAAPNMFLCAKNGRIPRLGGSGNLHHLQGIYLKVIFLEVLLWNSRAAFSEKKHGRSSLKPRNFQHDSRVAFCLHKTSPNSRMSPTQGCPLLINKAFKKIF